MIKFSNTCVIMGFTVKINLFKYKKFKDGRCRYNNTGSRHLMTPLAEICHFINENIRTCLAIAIKVEWLTSLSYVFISFFGPDRAQRS